MEIGGYFKMKNGVIIFIMFIILANCGEVPSVLDVKFDKGEKGTPLSNGLIHNFENTYNTNLLGGWTGCGAGNNDSITNVPTTTAFYNGVKSLKVIIHHSQENKGYIWMAFNLGDTIEIDPQGKPAPQKRDVSNFKYLSFYIMVTQYWTKFYVGLGDITLSEGESIDVSVTIIKKPQSWQQIKIPLEEFKGIDLTRVTKVIVKMDENIETQENVTFYLDDIAFSN